MSCDEIIPKPLFKKSEFLPRASNKTSHGKISLELRSFLQKIFIQAF